MIPLFNHNYKFKILKLLIKCQTNLYFNRLNLIYSDSLYDSLRIFSVYFAYFLIDRDRFSIFVVIYKVFANCIIKDRTHVN